MGCCINSKKPTVVSTLPDYSMLLYPRIATINVKTKFLEDSHIELQPITFKHTEPSFCTSKLLQINMLPFKVSACILPGVDPRGELTKPCQDNCFIDYDSESILLGLYDGHGKYGDEVVQFAESFMLNYYEVNKQAYLQQPSLFLVEASQACDKALKNSEIDCEVSGSTQVLVLIQESSINVAGLGDSRAILATYAPPDVHPAIENVKNDRPLMANIRKRRQVVPVEGLTPVQLTKDQVPEDNDEYIRILQYGGRVQRLQDSLGHPFGPYRVWLRDQNVPGLAMSRSIGDTIASSVGVISTPVITSHVYWPKCDAFLVIASDGIWDVMNNEEVINFVERYRHNCCDTPQDRPANGNVRPTNTNIAHLLCEEARVRWLSVVEQEDATIDDISCIILEFLACSNFQDEPTPVRYKMIPTMASQFLMRDPMRASFVEEKVNFSF